MTVFLKSWIFSTGAASRVLPLHIVHIPFLHSMVRVCLTNAKNSFQISVYNKLSTRDLSLIKKTGSKAEDAKRSSLLVTRRGSIRKKCIRNKSITGRAQFESFGDKVRETRLKCVDMCRWQIYCHAERKDEHHKNISTLNAESWRDRGGRWRQMSCCGDL